MKYEIASLRPADRLRWETLWREYQVFYDVDLPAEVTARAWQRMQDGQICGLGAHDPGGALLGIVHYLFHEDTWSTRPACYLQDLYVDPAARGTGCARLLIEAVAREAQAAGANEPYWLTHETNVVARRLYDRIGRNSGFIQYVFERSPGR